MKMTEKDRVVYVIEPWGRRVATIKEFFAYHARKRGVSVAEVVRECYDQGRALTQKSRWGSMPSEYDPSRDESHPMMGWKE